ncbi:hypothetical protein EJ06DRAFT_541041 [Trichodelitschia bisporula]|uniref:Alpha/beta hydrolase fold-3 domain-containing protein n=1 Tax=Trichodelitschia bisporula TaxID=703511 RepID=A0A6G1I8A9_9PEZI|nr:hypothetical protein EJ06DRAFT_541041 [Trichodelitschia bisporula]
MADEGFAAPWVAFEKELGQRPLLKGGLEAVFKAWAALGGALVSKYTFPAPDPSVNTKDQTLPNSSLKIRIYTPKGYDSSNPKPVGLYIHGGGWAMGDLDADDATCRAIAAGAGVVLVSVDYRLAPQNPYPAGLDDCAAAFRWMLENARALGGVEGKVWTVGASAGGGSALGLALKLVDEGLGDKVAGIVSQVPVTVHPDAVPERLRGEYTSYEEHKEHTVNSKEAMYTFWNAYGAPPTDKYASPLLHPKLAELPKTYITCAGHDTLRDDARLMRAELEAKGVPVKYDEFPGYPHYFWTFPSAQLKEPASEYIRKLVAGVAFVLS